MKARVAEPEGDSLCLDNIGIKFKGPFSKLRCLRDCSAVTRTHGGQINPHPTPVTHQRDAGGSH